MMRGPRPDRLPHVDEAHEPKDRPPRVAPGRRSRVAAVYRAPHPGAAASAPVSQQPPEPSRSDPFAAVPGPAAADDPLGLRDYLALKEEPAAYAA
jgi:hypothetical protein